MKYILMAFFIFSFHSLANADLPEDSVYLLDSTWLNQDASEVKLSDFQGKTTVITMTYMSCPHACPMILAKVKKIKAGFDKKGIKNYHLVFASFDPKVDKPKVLKTFMNKRNVNSREWTFLTAKNPESVRELAAVLGINFKDLGDGNFSHSNIISLLNDKGQIVKKVESLSANEDPLIEAATNLSK